MARVDISIHAVLRLEFRSSSACTRFSRQTPPPSAAEFQCNGNAIRHAGKFTSATPLGPAGGVSPSLDGGRSNRRLVGAARTFLRLQDGRLSLSFEFSMRDAYLRPGETSCETLNSSTSRDTRYSSNLQLRFPLTGSTGTPSADHNAPRAAG